MGLLRTLSKDNNSLYTEFKDAYWSIESILYTTDMVQFTLVCYPSREAKYMNHKGVKNLPFGAPVGETFSPSLYMWHSVYPLRDVYPHGVPVDPDEQKTRLYNFLKIVSDGQFTDVIED